MLTSHRIFSVIIYTTLLLLAGQHSAIGEEDSPAPIEGILGASDAKAGEQVFLQCRACHIADKTGKHAIGPNLWNLVGREIGSARGYEYYSTAMAKQRGRWNFRNLNIYLWNPQQFVPNTRMTFPGIKPTQDRANVIAYLRSLSDSPLPFPPVSKDVNPGNEGTQQDWGGLPPDTGREEVFYTCQACHSLQIVKQQGLSRDSWDETLEWMVEEQGMEEPSPENRQRILDYLANHFGLGR